MTATTTTFFYPVEIRDPNVPREKSFFFIEVEARDPYEAALIGSGEADAMLIAYKPTQVCKWWPVRMCPSVADMLKLRADMDKARFGQRSRSVRAHAKLLAA